MGITAAAELPQLSAARQLSGSSDATGASCHHSLPQSQINKEKNYVPSFHPFPLSIICTISLGWEIINPRPNFFNWHLKRDAKFSHLPVLYQSACEITLPHLSWWHCSKTSFLPTWNWKIKVIVLLCSFTAQTQTLEEETRACLPTTASLTPLSPYAVAVNTLPRNVLPLL